MRSPYAFWRAPAALNVLSSFLVRKTISTLGQDLNYLIGNTLYEQVRRSKIGARTSLLGCGDRHHCVRSVGRLTDKFPGATLCAKFLKRQVIKTYQKRIERDVGFSGISQTLAAGIVVPYPKIQSVETIDDCTLLVEFDNSQKRKYDVTPLLRKEMFAPLRNPALFKSVQMEQGGYAVVWNNTIDISEYELWINGQTLL